MIKSQYCEKSLIVFEPCVVILLGGMQTSPPIVSLCDTFTYFAFMQSPPAAFDKTYQFLLISQIACLFGEKKRNNLSTSFNRKTLLFGCLQAKQCSARRQPNSSVVVRQTEFWDSALAYFNVFF